MLSALLTLGLLAQTPASNVWDCISDPKLPREAVRFETVVVDRAGTAQAQQVAMDQAMRRLEARLCNEVDCPGVRQAITPWARGETETKACAVAVVPVRVVQEFVERQGLTEFDQKLDQALSAIFGPKPAPEDLVGDKRREPGEVVIAIDKIEDAGAPGGARAKWLMDRLLVRMANWPHVVVREVPQEWGGGERLPKGLDVLLDASIVRRREGLSPILEVTWRARLVHGEGYRLKGAPPVTMLEAVAPVAMPVSEFPSLPPNPTLEVRTNASASGSLCAGQTTQLHVWSKKARYVRVFNLFGKSRATLLFPNEFTPAGKRSSLVKANETMVLGPPEGFQAFPLEGDGEGFLVLAAEREEDLGEFRYFNTQCRVSPKLAQRLWDPARLPARLSKALSGYRILRGGQCPPVKAEALDVEAALAQLPECAPQGPASAPSAEGPLH